MRRLGLKRFLAASARTQKSVPVKPLILRRRELGLSFEQYKALQKVSLIAEMQRDTGAISLEDYVRLTRQTAHVTRVLYHHLGASTLPEHLLDAPTEKTETPVC